MINPKLIIDYYNPEAAVTRENFQLAKKVILLELKVSFDNTIKIGNDYYSKNDLLECFDFFDEDNNWEQVILVEKYPFLQNLDDLKNIKEGVQLPRDFHDDQITYHSRVFITKIYFEPLKQELRKLLKSDAFLKVKMVLSYCSFFTFEAEQEGYQYVQSQLEVRIQLLEKDYYTFKQKFETKVYYQKDFIELAEVLGDVDPSFLNKAFNMMIHLYRHQQINAFRFIRSLWFHLKISHSQATKDVIKENITLQIRHLFSFAYLKQYLAVFVIVLVIIVNIVEQNDTPVSSSEEYTLIKKDVNPLETESGFIGGNGALVDFIHDNLNYPEKAIEKKIEGKVVLSFIVYENGIIGNVTIVKGAHPILNKSALELMKKMPLWKPEVFQGKKVRSKYKLPINFELD